MKHVSRRAERTLRRLLRAAPAVLVFGPRQCGKTTAVRAALPDWRHVDLERARQAEPILADVEGWLQAHPRGVVVDEAQRFAELFPALRVAIDAGRGPGRFVLTGSASPTLLTRVSESLAGRVALLELTPLLGRELAGTKAAADRWFWGGFPRVHALRGRRARLEWLDDYVTTVLERDLPALGVRMPPARLRLLLQMLVHVHGNVLNVSDLARSLGVSVPTVANDLDVLEGIFLVRRLPPFFANVQKRLTKSPKIYVRDTGILHLLAGLGSADALATWARRGASFEGLVVEEVAALARELVVRPGLHFWRTQAGGEVDLIVTDGRRIIPIEIKVSGHVDHYALRALHTCMADLGAPEGFIIVASGEREQLGRGVEIVPWADLVSGRCDFGLGRRG